MAKKPDAESSIGFNKNMIERITHYPGYLLRFSAEGSAHATLILHGFPAVRAVKNLDLADVIHRKLNEDVYILHYHGLGDSPGTFKFTNAIFEGIDVANFILKLKNYRSLRLIGHSFGGLVATNIARALPDNIHQLILLSPLCDLEVTESLYRWCVDEVRLELPNVFGSQSDAEVRADVDLMIQNNLPKNLVQGLSKNIRVGIIQAKNDDVTLTSIAKAMLSSFSVKPNYVELDLDHGFTQDRQALANEVLKQIASAPK